MVVSRFQVPSGRRDLLRPLTLEKSEQPFGDFTDQRGEQIGTVRIGESEIEATPVGAIDDTERPLSNTRPGGRPRLATYGFQVPADEIYLAPEADASPVFTTPPLTGTSISAAVTSAISAVSWYYDEEASSAYELMDALYASASSLGDDTVADFCLADDLSCGPIRRLSLCQTGQRQDWGHQNVCPALDPDAPEWPPDFSSNRVIDLLDMRRIDVTELCAQNLQPRARYFVYVPILEKMPDKPCPFELYGNSYNRPQMTDAQSLPTLCSACMFARDEGVLRIVTHGPPINDGTLDNVWLRLTDDEDGTIHSFRIAETLGREDVVEVKGVDTAELTYSTAELVAEIPADAGPPVGVAEQIRIY